MATKRRRILARIMTVGFGILLALILVEVLLRVRAGYIARSEDLAANLVAYDSDYGWHLSSGWEGDHRHYDFKAHYRVNANGFRDDAKVPEGFKGRRIAVVGDSFTFGLGVNDDQTFCHLLSQQAGTNAIYINYAVPGYSTDQQALLIEKEILPKKPDEIILAVYVANDLFDNLREVPMQFSLAKPYFELGESGLALRNSPVPFGLPKAAVSGRILAETVMGRADLQRSWKVRLESHSEIFKLFSHNFLPDKDYSAEFETRFQPAVKLFEAILDRVASRCGEQGTKLTVALLAGRSQVAEPRSVSAQYQEYMRQKALAVAEAKGLATIDLAGALKAEKGAGTYFFSNDGHLNVKGHRRVAELLAGGERNRKF